MKIKPYYIEVETLDEYLDVCRHWNYYRQLCGAKDDSNIWYITEYNLKPADLNRWEVKKMFKRRPDILKMAKYHVGDICKTTHGEIGIFRGVQVTDEDYYWLIEDLSTGKNKCITCVEGCKAYNTFKPWPKESVNTLSSKLPGILLYKPMRIRTKATQTKAEQKLSGQLVMKDGVVFFQDRTGMCIPTSEIAIYCYIPKTK